MVCGNFFLLLALGSPPTKGARASIKDAKFQTFSIFTLHLAIDPKGSLECCFVKQLAKL